MQRASILFAGLLLCSGYAFASADEAPPIRADALVRQFARDKGIPGLAVAVGKDKAILWSAGIGEANIENHAAVSAERTKFRIGSASKALTSLGLARLVDSGRLQLDVPIQQHPGGAAGGSALIRIHPDQKLVICLLTNLSMIGDDRFSTLPDQLFALFSSD
ncbi:MAG TPA: serine hydrolase domain-containing protein [Povalibacter sp.]|uniref:serine hydrolase domain-containing protein n=1 Tax=Povalibacter sp. TaxID=1962978 RepID=UPI002BA00F49|nr:serine hydrolase domain-containing protein [Povalibacter sp.]HMN44407.1 serine hydrolase domain-containing protein [Povalibacter sp.]